jgi:hypothetical protein
MIETLRHILDVTFHLLVISTMLVGTGFVLALGIFASRDFFRWLSRPEASRDE